MIGTAIATTQPASKSTLVAEQRAQHPGAAATTRGAAPRRLTEREKQVARLQPWDCRTMSSAWR
jgi:hypothetical protein